MLFLAGIIVCGLPYTIHNLCPYSAVCFGFSKNFLCGLNSSAFGLTIAFSFLILVLAIFFGRLFCSFICPLGTIQEYIFALFNKKSKKKKRSHYLERRFSLVKYGVLAVTAILAIAGISYIYIRFCPIYAISMLPYIAVLGLILALLIIIVGIFIERFWCRYLCPYAALLNLFQYLGKVVGFPRLKIHRNLERCNDCGFCSLNCPMNIDLLKKNMYNWIVFSVFAFKKMPKPDTLVWKKDK
jgi:polyferredoxin